MSSTHQRNAFRRLTRSVALVATALLFASGLAATRVEAGSATDGAKDGKSCSHAAAAAAAAPADGEAAAPCPHAADGAGLSGSGKAG